ncbi:MAG: alpha-L-rhamnosidase N-terminal domain-containing protein [Planctomycetes bacterium]|nr:alpha-L-rhamnosidase N-terminal domain-containing protein [Planctomycetota bacterium]
MASNDERSRSGISRRDFLAASATGAGGGLLFASGPARAVGAARIPATAAVAAGMDAASGFSNAAPAIDLAPARWLWYPSQRCLPNTFVLFRREVTLAAKPKRAIGWIGADSRYLLAVNGERIQWGPAPSDPRWPDADPIDLTDSLGEGRNVFGATVLHYGTGDGTWPIGKPGFIFKLEIEAGDGTRETIASDATWRAHLSRAWKPGQHRRWYLRALQEEFDARLHPYGWDRADFAPDGSWLPARVLACPSGKPPICSDYWDYSLETGGNPPGAALRARQIPLLREYEVPAKGLADSFRVRWIRPPEEYFAVRTPGAFAIEREACAEAAGEGTWRVPRTDERAAALTFAFEEQIVGWPHFTIDAPAGTVVEVMTQESHAPDGPPWLDTHFFSWSRFICREGQNRFEAFDYESLRWLQLHIRGADRPVVVRGVGVRRRIYPWPDPAEVACGEPALQTLFDASVNTLNNSAQETIVDGMGRERQQYSGDCGHQLHAIYLAFGETRLPARYLRTFSEGMTLDGFFLDCWPAFDRLARLMERQVGMTGWGPLLDHGVGFNFDCWHHYLYTGDLDALKEPYPRLVRFFEYLRALRRDDGLLPVEGIGVPSVWIDHQAYRRTRHKQCAFNLYASAMFAHAFAPIARAFGDGDRARHAEVASREILAAAIGRFWDGERGLLVNNLPWIREEDGPRMCDRSLATSILFDQCPAGRIDASVRALAECPPEMGLSYPCNANWRLWALAKAGRADVILSDLRKRWATMPSVLLNNTIQEDWVARPDSGSQWSHCALVPLYVLFMDIAGIRPVEPGFGRCEIRPQLGDLADLRLVARTVKGPIRFAARGADPARRIEIALPAGCEGTLLLPAEWKVPLAALPGRHRLGLEQYRLPAGETTGFDVRRQA